MYVKLIIRKLIFFKAHRSAGAHNMKFSFTILILALLSCNGCVMNKLNHEQQTILLRQSVKGVPLQISVTKGSEWTKRQQAGPLVFNVLTQIVIWAEDIEGNYIETLYITGADYKELKHGAKKNKGAQFYRECFPVWSSKLSRTGKELPSPEKPYTDTVTSATPMDNFTVKTNIPGSFKPFVIFAEINKSADNNEHYTDENNSWAGQPSLVYRAECTEDNKNNSIKMEIAGHGGKIEDQPAIYSDLSTLDTALLQISSIEILVGSN